MNIDTAPTQPAPKQVSGDDGDTGHLEELRADPIGLMWRVREECGDVGEFRLADNHVVLLSGPEANEFFFRAPDEDLDQAAAYPFMKPIFGEGVVFDASPERRREMLHNQSLRDKYMRGHADTIANEVERMVANWEDEGEIDLLDWFAELTIYTSSACLVGKRFRESLDRRFAELFHELEAGTDALAFVDPYMDIPSFRRRDEARTALVALIQDIMAERISTPSPREDADLLDILVSIKNEDGTLRFSADEVTGMFISMMFAGHHTTSGTAAWTLIELLSHPSTYAAVDAEITDLFSQGEVAAIHAEEEGGSRRLSVSYQALREMPLLEASIKEALRLHPPLILLLRLASNDLEVEGVKIESGKLVGASPAISNRLPEVFGDADTFRPERYFDPENADIANPWTWIPFGAGRHRCVGAAFALMQLKAIFSVLLLDWEFEAAQAPETYHNDHSKMVVQLARPCAVRYRRKTAP
jgi:sterol 14-demethylase